MDTSRLRPSILFIGLIALSWNIAVAQDFETRLYETLDTYWNATEGIPGVGVVVISPKKDTIFTSIGIGNTLSSTPISQSTQFVSASISKTFTATLLLRLQEEGHLHIDDYLSDYLIIDGLDPQITIRQIMNHSSGIFDHFDDSGFWSEAVSDPYKVWNDDEVLSYSIPHGLTHNPGESYNYSNTGFFILGMLIHDLLGISTKEALDEWIAKPLGLKKTFLDDFSNPDNKIEGLAENHRAYEYHKSPVSMAGAIVSTPKEIARFLESVFVNDFLTEPSQSELRSASFKNSSYGLGTRVWRSSIGTLHYGHTGTLSGYKNISYHIPDINSTIAIMSNGYSNPSSGWWNLVDAIYETVFTEYNTCVSGKCPTPLPPLLNSITKKDGETLISWTKSDEPFLEGYRLYYSPIDAPDDWSLVANESILTVDADEFRFLSGSEFSDPTEIKSMNVKLVSIATDGTESPASDIYSYSPENYLRRLLIVDGFDRYAGSSSWAYPTHSFATHYLRLFQNYSKRDYTIETASNESVESNEVDLTNYDYVIWFVGDESTAEETLSSTEQAQLKIYLEDGGNLLISGSEIGWDLDQSGSSSDRNFYNSYLKASLANDGRVNNGPIEGINGSVFSELELNYGVVYDEDFPDEINPVNGGVSIAKFQNGANAGIAYRGTFGSSATEGRMIYYSIPLESIENLTSEENIATSAMIYFNNQFTTLQHHMCEGDSLLIGNQYVRDSGSYDELFQTTSGYDSLVTHLVSVSPAYNETVQVETLYSEPFLFGEQLLNTPGTYTEQFKTVNGCDSTVTLHLSVVLGVAENEGSSWVRVYPNPFAENFNIQIFKANEIRKITLLDLNGKVLLEEVPENSQELLLKTTHLKNGIYQLLIENHSRQFQTQTIIKK